jgi:nondiscriminating aspartyl-tRNA synthetase
VHRVRDLSSVTFVLVRDRSGVAQVVVEEPAARDHARALVPESVVEVEGTVAAVAQAPGGVELHQPRVAVVAAAWEPPPVELHRPAMSATLPTLLDHAAVSLRHPRRVAIQRIAAASVHGFRRTLDDLGFTEIHTPKVVGAATETGATVFRLDWFGREAFLAQSPQLYKQLMVGALERVYETGPVFRAEPHDTTRHLAQYLSMDVELGFIQDHRDVMDVLRQVLASMVGAIERLASDAVEMLGLALPVVPEPIPLVRFEDGLRMVGEALGTDLANEPDLAPEHERWLGAWALREHGSDLLFVEGYPMVKRPFYTHPDPHDPRRSNSFDLLFRGMELVTGGQRLHRYADYLEALDRRREAVEPYAGYLEAFRHGMPPHGGFAIGLERWVAQLVGAANIREVTLLPRDLHRLTP